MSRLGPLIFSSFVPQILNDAFVQLRIFHIICSHRVKTRICLKLGITQITDIWVPLFRRLIELLWRSLVSLEASSFISFWWWIWRPHFIIIISFSNRATLPALIFKLFQLRNKSIVWVNLNNLKRTIFLLDFILV